MESENQSNHIIPINLEIPNLKIEGEYQEGKFCTEVNAFQSMTSNEEDIKRLSGSKEEFNNLNSDVKNEQIEGFFFKEEVKYSPYDLHDEVQIIENPAKKFPEEITIIDSPYKSTSATTKALKKQLNNSKKKKKKFKKKFKCSAYQKITNKYLSEILYPKSALTLLRQLEPGCHFKLQEYSYIYPREFVAQVQYNGLSLGIGHGISKNTSKTAAAENAIKAIVLMAMSKDLGNLQNISRFGNLCKDEKTSKFPLWTGLASFALFKLFSEWEKDATNFPIHYLAPKWKTTFNSSNFEMEQNFNLLHSSAAHLNPTTILSIMKPGVTPFELKRENGPTFRVTMAYKMDGQTFSASGTSKKLAKREAAKTALAHLWGIKFL